MNPDPHLQQRYADIVGSDGEAQDLLPLIGALDAICTSAPLPERLLHPPVVPTAQHVLIQKGTPTMSTQSPSPAPMQTVPSRPRAQAKQPQRRSVPWVALVLLVIMLALVSTTVFALHLPATPGHSAPAPAPTTKPIQSPTVLPSSPTVIASPTVMPGSPTSVPSPTVLPSPTKIP